MTDAPTTAAPEPSKLIGIWAESLGQVLGQIAGSSFACAVLAETPSELLPASAVDLWISCACSGGLRGEMSLRLTPLSATQLARIFTGEPPAEEPSVTPQAVPEAEGAQKSQTSSPSLISAEHAEAVVELFRQIAGLVSSALKPQWGEVQLHLEAASGPPSWPASSAAWLRAGENPWTFIEVHLSAALVAALRADVRSEPRAETPAPMPEKNPNSPAEAARVASAAAAGENNVPLHLLMDVELALTLRFGSRSLPLAEILDLNPGSVVELDRQVEEPVDVLLDGRIVARGEVVVMDGNYALRVSEVGPAPGA